MFSDSTLGDSQKSLLSYPLVLQTTDVDAAASLLATSAVPYRSELLAPASNFSTQIFGTHSPRMHLSRVRTTGEMRVQAQLPPDSYAVVLALSGDVEHQVAGETVRVRSGYALVQSPLQPVDVHTPESFELLFLRLSREILVEELQKLLGREMGTPLSFAPGFNVRTQAGQRFRRLVLGLCAHLDHAAGYSDTDGRGSRHDLAARGIENDLVTLLLEGHRHNYRRLLARKHDADPWQVRAAEEFIRANAHLTLTLGDICVAAGVGSRTLQHSFQRKRGCSPMQFLRQLRLERVRTELAQPGPSTTVTRVASSWGFLHFGRFAAEYHARFSEKPSETLRRANGVC